MNLLLTAPGKFCSDALGLKAWDVLGACWRRNSNFEVLKSQTRQSPHTKRVVCLGTEPYTLNPTCLKRGLDAKLP